MNTFEQQLSDIAAAIRSDFQSGRDIDRTLTPVLPSRVQIRQLLDGLLSIVFPCLATREDTLSARIAASAQLLTELLTPLLENGSKAAQICLVFLRTIPSVRALAQTDVQAAFDGDPAAESTAGIIASYPGLYAVTVYRLAHELYRLDVPILPRMMTELAHSATGIDIHPGARIGRSFFIDHGTGTVIGQTTVIGDRVKIYQGVTLGGLSTRSGRQLQGVRRHPTIQDDVTIYAGATILGGETVIGQGCIIGANAFITRSVTSYTRVNTETPALQYTALGP